MYVSFNETNPHISKIIEEADISGSGDLVESILPAVFLILPAGILILPAANKLLMNRNLRLQIILELQIHPMQNYLSLGRQLKIIRLTWL